MLSMATTTNNSLSQYALNQKQEDSCNQNCSKSPSPTMVPQPHINQHSSVTLPSIHSLDIPAFPHFEEYNRASIFSQYASASSSPTPSTTSNSPTLLIPSDERSPVSTYTTTPNALLSPIASPYSSSMDATRSRSGSNFSVKSEQVFSLGDPQQQQQQQQQQPVPSSPDHSMLTSSPTQAKKNWKPRKKRQCPECKLYFSNLATHKSTHLKPNNRPHICKYCERGFARPNDLFRHVKCHWKEIGSDKGQFKCPFKNIQNGDELQPQPQPQGPDHCCHNTGIFSRCDTFKNHLKAIHFQYPNGTKKEQRNQVSGKCRMCQTEFKNVDDWMHNHIETDQCPYAINLIKKDH
ncbi:Transcriptional regulator STP4 [Candida viswanathii]|uniref:Transcriptional regulator STP4 n=1 Tax=Candida viswanathii TaxID=5486 RepID=A0A367XPI1_9ASCO|nr:Transcriptional regulator STP4 [Candida viswanathii]